MAASNGVEWRFEIAEENLKVFVAALHCLAQVGKELAIECECDSGGGGARLTLRALNDAHSASSEIVLDNSFFAASGGGANGSSAGLRACFGGRMPFVRCKVFAKSCCNVFRTLKHVRSAQLVLVLDELSAAPEDDEPTQDGEDNDVEVDCVELRWKLSCDFDITKTHRMKVHTSQAVRAVFDKQSCPSKWSTRHHHLSSLLGHINHTNEVAVTCSPAQVKFESYFPNTADGKTNLHTETTVETSEFDAYSLASSQEVLNSSPQLIFGLKEVRALLAFCKASDILEINFYFSSGGSPVMFAAESTALAKCSIEVTLSTVATFLPAASQTQSEEALATGLPPLQDVSMENSDMTLTEERYLTRENDS